MTAVRTPGDPIVSDIVESLHSVLASAEAYERHRGRAINLVASENLLSPLARRLLAGDFAHRYCIPPEGQRPASLWDYPNQRHMREVYRLTSELACRVFGGADADIRPLSGNNAAFILLKSLTRRGDTVMSVPADCGGHFATRAICDAEELRLVNIPYDHDHGTAHAAATAELARAVGARVVFLDASTLLFPHPVAELHALLPSDTVLAYDASHVMGLIAGGKFQSPLSEGADLLQGSTHKSLFGPQKGLFVFREDARAAVRIRDTITPLFVSNAHSHHVLVLAVALAEVSTFGEEYSSLVVRNARTMGETLASRGHDVLFADRGFTDCHQLLWSLGESGHAHWVYDRLERVGLHTNLIRIPFRTGQLGFRIGAAEVTRRGFGESEAARVGELLSDAATPGAHLDSLRSQVAELSAAFDDVFFHFGRH